MRRCRRSKGRKRVGVEDGEQFVTSYGIIVNSLGQSQDHSCLESDATKSTAIKETLSSDGNVTNLPHLVATIGHLLVGEVGDLHTELLNQLEVDVGAGGCGKVW